MKLIIPQPETFKWSDVGFSRLIEPSKIRIDFMRMHNWLNSFFTGDKLRPEVIYTWR